MAMIMIIIKHLYMSQHIATICAAHEPDVRNCDYDYDYDLFRLILMTV